MRSGDPITAMRATCVSSCGLEMGRPLEGPMTSSMSAKWPGDTDAAASAAASKFMSTFSQERASGTGEGVQVGGGYGLRYQNSRRHRGSSSYQGRCATMCRRWPDRRQRTISASRRVKIPCFFLCSQESLASGRTEPRHPLQEGRGSAGSWPAGGRATARSKQGTGERARTVALGREARVFLYQRGMVGRWVWEGRSTHDYRGKSFTHLHVVHAPSGILRSVQSLEVEGPCVTVTRFRAAVGVASEEQAPFVEVIAERSQSGRKQSGVGVYGVIRVPAPLPSAVKVAKDVASGSEARRYESIRIAANVRLYLEDMQWMLNGGGDRGIGKDEM
jgi:hypothetical protein